MKMFTSILVYVTEHAEDTTAKRTVAKGDMKLVKHETL